MMGAMSADAEQLTAAFGPEAEREIARYGITRVPVDYFHWREFRYTNLDDAIAQAKRAQTKQSQKSSSAIGPEAGDKS